MKKLEEDIREEQRRTVASYRSMCEEAREKNAKVGMWNPERFASYLVPQNAQEISPFYMKLPSCNGDLQKILESTIKSISLPGLINVMRRLNTGGLREAAAVSFNITALHHTAISYGHYDAEELKDSFIRHTPEVSNEDEIKIIFSIQKHRRTQFIESISLPKGPWSLYIFIDHLDNLIKYYIECSCKASPEEELKSNIWKHFREDPRLSDAEVDSKAEEYLKSFKGATIT